MSSYDFSTDSIRAKSLNRTGIEHYARWEMDSALTLFQEAVRLDDSEAEYHLNLARAQVRMGNYEQMLQALGRYLGLETDDALLTRFEAIFSSGLDDVERLLTTMMPQHGAGLEVVGAAIQMWVEYRVGVGRRYLDMSHPEAWAATLDYTVRKINFIEATVDQLSEWYNTNEGIIRASHADLIDVLDIMPCDYRYFRAQENPLDKLVEAAMMLEELEKRFRAT